MNREGVSTIYKDHLTRFSGTVVLVILSILLFISNLRIFFLNMEEAEEMKEYTLKINKRDCIF